LFIKNSKTYNTLKTEYSTNFKNYSEQDLLNYYDKLTLLVNDNVTLLDKMVLMLNNTIASSSLPDSEINSMKANIIRFQ
jgi:hypothetical protein